jgi:universal stress protein A
MVVERPGRIRISVRPKNKNERQTMKTNSPTRSARLTFRVSPKGADHHRTAEPAPEINLVPLLLKLQSILVPIDFSEPSKKALRYALPFAEQFGAKITLLHVVEPVAMLDFAYFPLAMENKEVMDIRERNLELLGKQHALDPSVIEKTVVRYGKPFREICDAARSLKADLIIIATHGYTGLNHALLGSTAERVVRHAPCPVLVVREQEREFIDSKSCIKETTL